MQLYGGNMNIKKISEGIVALYIRVSTLNQVDRDSLKTQEERLKAYCTANGIKEFKIYREAGFSAKDTKRPAFEDLMRDIKEGKISSVFVIKLDRITRSMDDLLYLTNFFNKYDVKFVSITESIDTSTAMGRAMQYLLGVFAQLEREVTAERVAVDMRHRAIKGKWNGGVVPYGYTTQKFLIKNYNQQGIESSKAAEICPEDKKLYVNPEESEIVKWIYATFLNTNSIRRTTILLNARGVKTRKRDLWSKTTIHRLLSSPTYVGKIWYGKRKTDPVSGKLIAQEKKTWTIAEGEHDAIISDDIFEKAKNLLSQNKGKPTKSGRTYLLSGIIKCGLCGRAMTGHTFKKKTSPKVYSYYKCYSKLQKGNMACQGLSLPAGELEGFIIKHLKELSKNTIFLSDKKKMLEILESKTDNNGFDVEIQRIDKEYKNLNDRKDTLLEKLERRLISDDDFQSRYERINNDMTTLDQEKTRIMVLGNSRQVALNSLELSFEEISSFGHSWEYLDDTGKAMRIKSIVKEIRATKENIDLDIYLDVANMSRTGMDSWQPPA